MKQVPAGFTLDQLLAYLRSESPDTAQGFFTSREWAEHFQIPLEQMYGILIEAKRKGILIVSKGMRERVDSVVQRTSVYAFNLETPET